MRQQLKKRHSTNIPGRSRTGFTIVELIIVIIVVGILAGVTVVGFGVWQRSTTESLLKSDLLQASTAMEDARNWGDDYPGSIPSSFSSSDGVTLLGGSADGTVYCIEATSDRYDDMSFYIQSGESVAQEGHCPGAWTQISSGNSNGCGILEGRAYCWGTGASGQLGNGSTGNSSTPVPVDTSVMSGTVTAISTGSGFACAIASGSAYCWGSDQYGRLGNTGGSTSTPSPVDTSVMSGTVTAISAGKYHTCAISAGDAYCWGSDIYGGGGGTIGSSSNQYTPVAVNTSVMSGTVTAISAGESHTCAIASGAAYCWGSNTFGGLGDDSGSNQETPVAVNTSLMSGTVTSISAGNMYSCAVASGDAYCWGDGGYGGLGNGSTNDQGTPVAVNKTLMSGDVDSIAAGQNVWTTCAVSEGAAYCWGYNSSGQLGNGGSTQSTTPVLLDIAGSVTRVTSGGYTNCAVTAAGQAYCWGTGGSGQLGNGGTTSSSTPVGVLAPEV